MLKEAREGILATEMPANPSPRRAAFSVDLLDQRKINLATERFEDREGQIRERAREKGSHGTPAASQNGSRVRC
jgi:hypothetical protein